MADINELANMTDEEFEKIADSIEPEEQNEPSQDEDKSEENNTSDDSQEDEGNEPSDDSGSEGETISNEPTSTEPEADKADESKDDTVTIPALENAEQYEQFYKQVMAPIKANGKLIKLNSANDVISLIQQGANYTKKMQSIAPYRKQLKLLEDNELLDDQKLRFLIDVSKHDKDAIKKLLNEAKIDVSELDYENLDAEGNSQPIEYTPKTLTPTDQEVIWGESWRELLEQEKLDNIDTHSIIMNMDSASQKQVYENPQILGLMHMTQACGAYDKIVAEMDRLKTLGYIKDNAAFLPTFIEVKNLMLQHGLLNEEVAKLAGQPVEISRGPAPNKKPTMANDKQVRAAAPSRSTGKSTKPFLNPLNMSDEEFLKHYDEI